MSGRGPGEPPADHPRDDARDRARPGEGADDVGTVAEEAAKLLGALAGWAGDQGSEWTRGVAGLAGAAGGGVHDLARHVADGIDTGAPECTYCPVCRTVHLVRELSPEVRSHLTVAASSLVQAAAGILAAVEQHRAPGPDGGPAPSAPGAPPERGAAAGRARPDRSGGVEHIDLDGGFDDGPDDGPDDAPDAPDDPEERP